jgi:hypothetical protein
MPGMKRTLADASAPPQPFAKKRKVIHKLHHTQPTHIPEPISAELDSTGVNKGFFDKQLQRAIAVSCAAAGYTSTKPEALEMFHGLVDGCKSLGSRRGADPWPQAAQLTVNSHAQLYHAGPIVYAFRQAHRNRHE